jgi:type IV pilus assembly protein PilF
MHKAFPTAQEPATPAMRALFAVAAAFLLASCATREGDASGLAGGGMGASAIVTESDESSSRKRAKLHVELGVGYFQQGQTTVALDEVKQALAADPAFADAYNLRGLVYMRLHDAAGAEDSFRRALNLNPREPDTLHNYGWLLCQQNRLADAQRQFTAALSIVGYANRAKTLMTQGICQTKAGLRAEAERSLTQADELDPGNPVTGYNLASLFARREEWSQARSRIRQINNSPAANPETLWLGIEVERQLNNHEAASRLGAQLQRRFPQSREALAFERGHFDD